jgi:hypothetical protein
MRRRQPRPSRARYLLKSTKPLTIEQIHEIETQWKSMTGAQRRPVWLQNDIKETPA